MYKTVSLIIITYKKLSFANFVNDLEFYQYNQSKIKNHETSLAPF